MNKKQLIGKYKNLEGVWDAEGAELARRIFLQDLKQLDEPRKPVIPQFVVDWYEENKDDFEGNLFRCAYNIPSNFDGAKLNEFERWFLNASTKPFQTLVNMHQFGYEVEEEKRYLVKMKNIHSYSSVLKHDKVTKEYFFGSEIQMCASSSVHARKELEDAGFGWVFDCEGIEVEEVERWD